MKEEKENSNMKDVNKEMKKKKDEKRKNNEKNGNKKLKII